MILAICFQQQLSDSKPIINAKDLLLIYSI